VLFADEPVTWPNPPPTTILQTLLVFAGIPLLITAVIVLLVMLPSLSKRSGENGAQGSAAKSEWFGSSEPPAALQPGDTEGAEQRQLTGSTRAPATEDETGGASVRW
jgi:hypothetical protein